MTDFKHGVWSGFPDIELVAAKVHDSWIKQKQAQGIFSAKSQITGEEQMRPYNELSDVVKEYDRATVLTVYAAIKDSMPLPNPPEDL